MTEQTDQVTVGLTDATHALLKKMYDDGYFREMRDGYRFGMAYAAANGLIASESTRTSHTFLNIGSFDPDGAIREGMRELFPDGGPPYRIAERLAEAGVAHLGRLYTEGTLRMDDIFKLEMAETEDVANEAVVP